MQNDKLLLLVFIIVLLSFFIIGCGSNNDASPEPIEPEEIAKAEPEEAVIEQEPEPEPEAEAELEAEKIADEQEEAEIEEEPKNEVVVSVDVLRLRSGPSTDHEILDRLRLGTILEVIDEQDEWLQVTRREGWVHGDYVVKPEDPEKLYEVLPVEVQPVGYTKEEVASFVEEFTSFGCSDLVFPEFNHPNEINDLDLIRAIQESKRNVVPKYYRFYGASYQFSLKDMQEAARAVFGIDLKDIQLYSDRDILGVERLSGCAFSTETRVLNVIEKEKEFLVDVVHLTYYHCPYEMDTYYLVSEDSRRKDYDCFEDFLDNNLDLGDSQNTDEIIEQHIKTFPVRRYILSKEGDGILYIRQSYILSGN